MSNELRKQIYGSLSQKGTDELIEIWLTNDHIEWTEMAFDVIREILQERFVELPSQDVHINITKETSKSVVHEVTDMTLAQVYFSFNGRIGLTTFWLKGVLPIVALTFIVVLIDVAYFDNSSFSGILSLLWRILIIWPSLALTVKRWHDRDKSGWWVFIGIIPIIGIIWAFIENGFLTGTNEPNQYGSKSF